MPFDVKLFSDLVDALGKVVGAVKGIANIPPADRAKYRQVFDDTYRMLDTTLNMVIIRLGDTLLADDNTFVASALKLNNYSDWLQAEREFRLCQSLRAALSETHGLWPRLKGKISEQDWTGLIAQMNSVLATEGELGQYVSSKLSFIAQSAAGCQQALRSGDTQGVTRLREEVSQFRQALLAEREELIQQEAALYKAII